MTKAGTTRICAICERTLLMGERAIRYAPDEGAELVDVCPLCQDVALDAGWVKEGAPMTPTINVDRRRRRMLGADGRREPHRALPEKQRPLAHGARARRRNLRHPHRASVAPLA